MFFIMNKIDTKSRIFGEAKSNTELKKNPFENKYKNFVP